jgi:DNA replication protein DnaC
MKPTIFTTNLPPLTIKEEFGERFFSRVFATENTIIEKRGEDLRQREIHD